MTSLAVLAALLGALQDPAPSSGVALERTVKTTLVDWVGRKREVQRKESILLRGSNLVVTDLTYGEKLIIRTDQKKVWRADPLGGHYSVYTFDEAAAIRKGLLDELKSVKARVPGTPDEKEIEEILQGYDQFGAAPSVELTSDGARREVLLNGSLLRLSAEVDPAIKAEGYFAALGAIGAFPPAMTEKLASLGGFPKKGKIRYVLFMDRVTEEFEVTSARAQAVSDADFELPKGLVQVPLKDFGRPPERRPTKPAMGAREFKEDDK